MPEIEHNLFVGGRHNGRAALPYNALARHLLGKISTTEVYDCRQFSTSQKGNSKIRQLWVWLCLMAVLLLAYLIIQWFKTDADLAADLQTSNLSTVVDSTTVNSLDVDPAAPLEITSPLVGEQDQQNLVTNLALNSSHPHSEKEQANDESSTAQSLPPPELDAVVQQPELLLLTEITVDSEKHNVEGANQMIVDPEELRSLLKIDINYLIEQWRQAWQSGDTEAYLSLYSTQFTPAGDVDLSSWQQQRQEMVTPSKQITLHLSNFDVLLDELNQTSIVSFDQEYTSNSHTEISRKQLTLIKEDEWRIVAELTVE